jgi:outer membrane protein assembly factor BamB
MIADMLIKKIIFLATTTMLLLSGCSKVDDYFLGKDNTPKPKKLKKIPNANILKMQWEQKNAALKDYSRLFQMTPALDNKNIFVLNSQGTLVKLSKSSGEILWQSQLPHGALAAPKIMNDQIYLSSNQAEVISLRSSDGSIQWTTKTASDILSPPLTLGNKLIAKALDGSVYALDKNTGKVLWHYNHASPKLILKASAAPVSFADQALIAAADGKIELLDRDSGTSIWQKSVAQPRGVSDIEKMVDIDADPIVIDDSLIIASYQGAITRFSPETNHRYWRRAISVYQDMALQNGILYAVDNKSVIWAIAAENGVVLWKQKALQARGLTAPVVFNNYLVVADKLGWLHLLNRQTGMIISHDKLPGVVTVAPVTDNNLLYTLTDNGFLRAYLAEA